MAYWNWLDRFPVDKFYAHEFYLCSKIHCCLCQTTVLDNILVDKIVGVELSTIANSELSNRGSEVYEVVETSRFNWSLY